jgi:hypothetical protein
MPIRIQCPKCQQPFSVWEVGAIRDCPKCEAPLKVLGWPQLFAANAAMFVVLGFLIAGAFASGSAIGWLVGVAVLIAWVVLEGAAMRALLVVAVQSRVPE